MSFIFNKETFEDNSFNEEMRRKLTRALNRNESGAASSTDTDRVVASNAGDHLRTEGQNTGSAGETKTGFSKVDILKSGITVTNVEFPTIPRLEILDLDVSTQSKSLIKGICKVSCRDAKVQIVTEIEANLLLLHANSSAKFITPKFISNDSFTVPITMTFDQIHLEAITNIFVKNTGVGISFNDVNLDFQFQCSIKLLQSSIEKRLKASMEAVFKEVLPSVIFNMSQRWFTHGETQSPLPSKSDYVNKVVHQQKTILDDSDLTDLSPANMLRLSTLVSSRQTLCLNPNAVDTISTIPGCVERQNLHRFNLRIPSLNNYYRDKACIGEKSEAAALENRNTANSASYKTANTLPAEVLETNSYDLKTIAALQTKIFERTGSGSLKRRKFKIRSRHCNGNMKVPPPVSSTPVSASDTLKAAEQSPQANADTVNNELTPEKSIGELDAKKDAEIMNDSAKLEAPTAVPVASPSLGAKITSSYHNKMASDLKCSAGFANKSALSSNLNDDSYLLAQRADLHEMRVSLYSPIRNKNFCIMPQSPHDIRDSPRLLFDNSKRFSFVGLMSNNSWKWGYDPPPPYRETMPSSN